LRPGHHWIFEFGKAQDGSSCEKFFSLQRGKKVEYKGTLFYDGQSALVVKRWLHRVDDDASGLTFEEWDPTADVDDTQPPAAMIINSSELRGAGFNLKEVLPPELEAAARGGKRTRGAGLVRLEGMGRKRYILSPDVDTDLRSKCE
jgi:hypothetical protein